MGRGYRRGNKYKNKSQPEPVLARRPPSQVSGIKCQVSSHLFIVEDLYTFGVFPDVRDECLLDLVAFTPRDAEDEVV